MLTVSLFAWAGRGSYTHHGAGQWDVRAILGEVYWLFSLVLFCVLFYHDLRGVGKPSGVAWVLLHFLPLAGTRASSAGNDGTGGGMGRTTGG